MSFLSVKIVIFIQYTKLYKGILHTIFMDEVTLKRGITFSSQEEDFEDYDFGFLEEEGDFEDEVEFRRLKPKKPKIKFKFLIAS